MGVESGYEGVRITRLIHSHAVQECLRWVGRGALVKCSEVCREIYTKHTREQRRTMLGRKQFSVLFWKSAISSAADQHQPNGLDLPKFTMRVEAKSGL